MAKTSTKETILVIEDEPEISDFAARVCELEGYRVFQAEDGDVGLKLARQHHVAAMFIARRDEDFVERRTPEFKGFVVGEP